MKYSQFLEFNQLLESNKIDIDSWKSSDLKLIKEADEKGDLDTLNTQKGNIITKKGRMRKSLNKQAKKLMDSITQDVANKFLKPIKDLKVQVYKKMAEIGKGKQPREIVTALKADLQNIQKIQNKQMDAIEKHAQNTIDNNTKKINAAIEKKGLKDTAKADLQSYWGLLSTQIMMNLLQKIAIQDNNVIDEVIKDQDILKAAKQINALLNKPQRNKEAKLKAENEKLKGEIKKRDEAEEAAQKTSSEKDASTETPSAEPEKTE
jgi:vacuolar-type H+-ATPase catalytic subunit A/Vma1